MDKKHKQTQANIFDEFETSPLATGSPLPEHAEEFNPKETGAIQSRIDVPETKDRPSFDELAQAQQRKKNNIRKCVKCGNWRPADHMMNWGEGPICGDNCNGQPVNPFELG